MRYQVECDQKPIENKTKINYKKCSLGLPSNDMRHQ
jgi:hypothetical protein